MAGGCHFFSIALQTIIKSKHTLLFCCLLLIQSVQCSGNMNSDDAGEFPLITGASNNNSTKDEKSDLAVGLIACAVSTFFFGSSFVPVKKFITGDGMFFQWILCSAIWMTGLVVQLIRNSPPFQPLAMVGGMLWATGNICVVPVLKTIGLSLGMLLWGAANLVTGWASGRFGWFGITPEVPPHSDLNYAGVSLAIVGVVVFVFVRSEIRPISPTRMDFTPTENSGYQAVPDTESIIEKNVVVEKDDSVNSHEELNSGGDDDASWVDKLTPGQKKFVGVALSLGSGVFYGLNFNPVTYLIDNKPGISQNGLDYVFSHFCGIFLTSSVYFMIYASFKRNSPAVFPRVMLPGFASGVLWAIAESSWFVANQRLSQAVSFPIITTGPGIIASLWGIFVFGEIRGRKNFIILLIAFSFSLSGAALSTLSKIK